MIKRISGLVLIAIYLLFSVGCTGEWRRKFVRKKKYEKRPTPIFKPKEYEAEFTPGQRYANHYAFWKNAVSEVIKILGQKQINNKKLKFHASYTLEEIKQLHKLLPDEKQRQFTPYVEKLSVLVEKLRNSSYVSGHKRTLIKKLKHHYNEVSKNFSYNKMKSHLQ